MSSAALLLPWTMAERDHPQGNVRSVVLIPYSPIHRLSVVRGTPSARAAPFALPAAASSAAATSSFVFFRRGSAVTDGGATDTGPSVASDGGNSTRLPGL